MGSKGGKGLVELRDARSRLVVTISPEHGGEISSIVAPFEGEMVETIYRGNDFTETAGWRGRAPLLWPAVGRNYTMRFLERVKAGEADPRCGEYMVGGEAFPMPIHGFAMRKRWEVVEDEEGIERGAGYGDGGTDGGEGRSLLCRLRSDDETKTFYPFDFTVEVRYTLRRWGISALYRVISESDGLFFSIGNHISFNLPIGGKGGYEDTILRSSATRVLELTPYGLLSGVERERDFSKGCPLADKTLHDMVTGGVIKEGEAYVELLNPHLVEGASGEHERPYGIRVSQREVPVAGVRKANPDDFLLVLWGEPRKGYFCPEPWYGGPNSLNSRRGVVSLNAGEEFLWEMRIEFLI